MIKTGCAPRTRLPGGWGKGAFTKALYSQKTSTHHGKYVCCKRGIPDVIPYRKLILFFWWHLDIGYGLSPSFFIFLYSNSYINKMVFIPEKILKVGLKFLPHKGNKDGN